MRKNDNDFINKALINSSYKLEKISNTEERQYEIKSFILVALANIGFGFVNFHCKLTKSLFPESFDPVSFMIYRSFATCILAYYLCLYNNLRIIKWNEIKCKFWFFVRTVGTYFSFFTFIMIMQFFRASTAACINTMFPAIAIFLSIVFLHEEFYMRYVIGLLICLIGTIMIIFNERSGTSKISEVIDKSSEVNDDTDYLRILYGSIYGVANVLVVAMLNVSIKIVMNEKIPLHIQCFWVGFTNTLCGVIHVLFMGSLKLYLPYFLFSICNGGIYYLSNYLLTEGFRHIGCSKTAPLAYLTTITVFVLGALVLREQIFFTDFLGSMMILSFNLYNVYIPPN